MTYTLPALSKRSGISESKLRRLIADGLLEAGWDNGFIIDEDDLREWRYSLASANKRHRYVPDAPLGEGAVQDRDGVGACGEEPDGGRKVGPGEVRAIRAQLDRLKRAADDRRVQARRKPRGAVA